MLSGTHCRLGRHWPVLLSVIRHVSAAQVPRASPAAALCSGITPEGTQAARWGVGDRTRLALWEANTILSSYLSGACSDGAQRSRGDVLTIRQDPGGGVCHPLTLCTHPQFLH